jgi:hypothetical protein
MQNVTVVLSRCKGQEATLATLEAYKLFGKEERDPCFALSHRVIVNSKLGMPKCLENY